MSKINRRRFLDRFRTTTLGFAAGATILSNARSVRSAAANDRLVIVSQPPFAKGKWTHVVIVHEGLGTPAGKATLYLDGQAQGTSEGISEAFTWDMTTAAIRLGVNYVGLWDELAIFSRALSAEEVGTLHGLATGVAELR